MLSLVLQFILSHLLAFAFLALPLLYLYATRNHEFWKKRRVPGPKPLPFFGNNVDLFLHDMDTIEKERYRKYGKVYGTFVGSEAQLNVADPELVKLIAVKDWQAFINRGDSASHDELLVQNLVDQGGETWKRFRSIMSPTFTSGKIRRMYNLMQDCADDLLSVLEEGANSRTPVNMKRIFGSYSMDVIARCAFATKTNPHRESKSPFLINAYKIFEPSIIRLLVVSTLPRWLLKFFDIDIIPRDSRDFFKTVCYQLLKQRRQQGLRIHDFVQLLIEAKTAGERLKEKANEVEDSFLVQGDEQVDLSTGMKGQSVSKELTDDEIVPQMVLFLITGYGTTGSLLTFCAYCLAANQDKQEKLYREIYNAFGNGEEMSYESVQKLEYLNAVISETLRMYTPVPKFHRQAKVDYELGSTGIVIPKGTTVFLCFHAMHHDPEYFDKPGVYLPERFSKENASNIKPYTYLPFGAGPRNCIGMRFALIESKLVLCKVLLKYKLVASQLTKIPVQYQANSGLLEAKDVIVSVEKR